MRGHDRRQSTMLTLRKARFRGLDRTQLQAYLVAAAYNLIRIAKLSAAPA